MEEYHDEDWLRKKYEKHESMAEMAELVDVDLTTIKYWMDKHGIDRQDRGGKRVERTNYRVRDDGYITAQGRTAYGEVARIHRLIAVAEWGMDAVSGMQVHHQNGIPWDNRASNLELLSPSEHATLTLNSRDQSEISKKNAEKMDRDEHGRFVAGE
jgi:hypothetical protein